MSRWSDQDERTFSYLPEVLLHSKWENAFGRQIFKPDLARLLVGFDALLALEVRDVHSVRVEAVDLSQQLPRP